MPELINPLSQPVTAQIRHDHAAVLALYHRLHPGMPSSVRRALVRRICAALRIHAQLEEEIFYPALRHAGMDLTGRSSAGIDTSTIDKSEADHRQMRELIGRVESLEGQDEAQDDALGELMNAVLHHVADEETRLLPQAERKIPAGRLAALCAQMRTRRMALAREQAGTMAADVARSAPGRSALAAALLFGTVWLLARPRPRAALRRLALAR